MTLYQKTEAMMDIQVRVRRDYEWFVILLLLSNIVISVSFISTLPDYSQNDFQEAIYSG